MSKKKILVTIMFPIYPPLGGGQVRVYNLYKNLAKYYDIEILCFGDYGTSKQTIQIADGLKETIIPKTLKHHLSDLKLSSKLGVSSADINIMLNFLNFEEYINELKNKSINAEFIVASHCYMFPLIKSVCPNKKIIYEAHNVEYIAKTNMMNKKITSKKISKKLFNIEKECCNNSLLITTCSREDKEKLIELYKIDSKKIIIIPNGVDSNLVSYTEIKTRIENKIKLNLENIKIGIFLGSSYPPNIEACKDIIKNLADINNCVILIIGTVCNNLYDISLPKNICLVGKVTEEEKNKLFSTADFALNTVYSGSGSNLKMFDYMSSGIPIISTNFGTRGIDNKSGLIICETKDLAKVINNFKLNECEKLVYTNRNIVLNEFDWGVIANKLYENIKNL